MQVKLACKPTIGENLLVTACAGCMWQCALKSRDILNDEDSVLTDAEKVRPKAQNIKIGQ